MDNHSEIDRKLGEMQQWQKDHEAEDRRMFAEFREQMVNLPTKDDTREIVRDTMIDVLFKAGRGTKGVILTVAVVIGALAVIGGAGKWLLGIIGFHYVK